MSRTLRTTVLVVLIGMMGLCVAAEGRNRQRQLRHHSAVRVKHTRHASRTRKRVRVVPGRVTYHIPRHKMTAYGKRRDIANLAAVNNTEVFPKGAIVELLVPSPKKNGEMVVAARRIVGDKMGPRFRAMSKPCVDFYCVGGVPDILRTVSGKTCRLRVTYYV